MQVGADGPPTIAIAESEGGITVETRTTKRKLLAKRIILQIPIEPPTIRVPTVNLIPKPPKTKIDRIKPAPKVERPEKREKSDADLLNSIIKHPLVDITLDDKGLAMKKGSEPRLYSRALEWIYGDKVHDRESRDPQFDIRLKRLHQSLPPLSPKKPDPVPEKPVEQEKDEETEQEVKRPIITGYRCITSNRAPMSQRNRKPLQMKKSQLIPATPKPKLLSVRSRCILERSQTIEIERLLKIQFQYEFYAQQQKRFEENRVRVTRAKVEETLGRLVVRERRGEVPPTVPTQ